PLMLRVFSHNARLASLSSCRPNLRPRSNDKNTGQYWGATGVIHALSHESLPDGRGSDRPDLP
ncbi:MAG: hypothetical protein FWD61_19725, partial [Phycisphaerales bacterium]|nr:hypothetical protein [Phycisphaerales bacterium]